MIQLSLDEAEAFDRLSILEVKRAASIPCHDEQRRLGFEVMKALGEDRFGDIVDSQEYLNLKSANRRVFALIDAAWKDECLASDVQKANRERFLAKKILQEVHFSTPLTERKSEH